MQGEFHDIGIARLLPRSRDSARSPNARLQAKGVVDTSCVASYIGNGAGADRSPDGITVFEQFGANFGEFPNDVEVVEACLGPHSIVRVVLHEIAAAFPADARGRKRRLNARANSARSSSSTRSNNCDKRPACAHLPDAAN